MKLFRVLLVILSVNILIYTLYTGTSHGWNLLSIFVKDISEFTWPGQFNTDFTSFLLLSGLWTMWRQKFSAASVVLGLVAFVGGIIFLAPYLLYLSFKNDGDIGAVLLGKHFKS
ncbi:hypothetical protein [uncultured Croceitalea sp.]|uniref:hypothetical protein n=1 Tax=uncultured Croceitalea sp. TaxID=1798908 RepID=UPI003305BF84